MQRVRKPPAELQPKSQTRTSGPVKHCISIHRIIQEHACTDSAPRDKRCRSIVSLGHENQPAPGSPWLQVGQQLQQQHPTDACLSASAAITRSPLSPGRMRLQRLQRAAACLMLSLVALQGALLVQSAQGLRFMAAASAGAERFEGRSRPAVGAKGSLHGSMALKDADRVSMHIVAFTVSCLHTAHTYMDAIE